MKFTSLSVFLLGTIAATAAEPTADKSQYNLFNPTPRELMREMSTDRPDKTESPYTVDAGHFQIESSLIELGITRRNGERSLGINGGNINLKAGLTNNIDFQLYLDSYLFERTRFEGKTSRHSGFGDVTTRLKINLWGNDGGTTALALMPLIKWPTATNQFGNGKVEGGLIVPFAVELPFGFGMGMMTEVDFVYRDTGKYGADFVNSVAICRDIVGKLGGYVEFFSLVQDNGHDTILTFDYGLTYAMTENIQFDAGVNIGLSRAAEDFVPFTGISVRF